MISRLYQEDSPFTLTEDCEAGRTETTKRFFKNGRVYTMVWRDKPVIEDTLLMLIKTAAYCLRVGEEYGGNPPKRSYKDFLVKTNLVI